MAPGESTSEVARPQAGPGETPVVHGAGVVEDPVYGHARVATASGRISEAAEVLDDDHRVPFTPSQLSRLDEALTRVSGETGLLFSVWVGELGARSRDRAEELHATLGESAADAVLIAVSPGERVVEIVTGEESIRRVDDDGAKRAAMAMVAKFSESDLVGGLIEGLRILGDHAGSKR